jgi:serine/threonine protein kinase/dipeptidyl aminopeptidase/acylaminoacyl peptidase
VGRTDLASWRRVREIFDTVVSLAPAERASRLESLCAGDPDLRAEVESLLSHDGPARDTIASVVARAARDATQPQTELHTGQTLLHYTLAAKIGEGGMGVVWRATDRSLGRDVAIKVLPADVASDTSRLSRFEREAKLLAALNHDNIAAIYSVHESGGVRFLAMEYVDGEDLATRIARGALPLEQTLAIARQIAEALEEAHEKGIVHRDLKPANVKLKSDGKVKVLDFGLAKALDTIDTPQSSQLATQAGLVMGTGAYMPPEQARGLRVDKRADNWAFGVVLFEMLSGRRPFVGATLTDVLAAVVTAEPDWRLLPAATPPSLLRLVRRCLQKDVRQRLRDIGDARIEINALIGGSTGDSSAPLVVTTSPVLRPRWREAAIFVLGAAAAGLTVWLVTRTAPVVPDVQRLNVALAPGTRLEDVLEAGRQTLALSRDGTRLAFVTRGAGGRKQIHLRRLDSVAVEPVPGTEGGDMPFFSPDGAWIGYAADGKLLRVPVAGGQPAVICDAPEPRGATWGEDGTILFAPGVFSGLSRVSTSGGPPVPVTTLPAGVETGHRWPSLLPGGRAALFNVETPGPDRDARTVEVVQLETGERRPLLRGASYARYVDGHVIFGQAGRLLAAPFDLSRLELTGPAVTVLDDVRMDLELTGRVFVDVAASGALVYVPGAPRPGERTLIWIDRHGNSTPATPEKRAYSGARLSPDGHTVATTIEGPPNSLWTYDLVRGAWKRLTFDGHVTTPAWTPDGAHLLYALRLPSGGPAIYRIATNGGGTPERLTSPPTPRSDMPDVSPSGRTALFTVQNSAGDDIHSLSLDAPYTIAPFHAAAANETSPSVSPSGRYVAYSSTESGRREIYIRPFAGPARTWSVSTGGGAAARWRRDERELFYLAGARMMAVSVNTTGDQLSIGTPQVLFEESALTWSGADLFRYDVAGDGQRFITVKPEAREEAPLQLVVIPQFAREMRARLARR